MGYKHEDGSSSFWHKENSWAHLCIRPDDGITLTINSDQKIHLPRHPDSI